MILDSFRLDGRVAFVTGADKGLGQAMALALAEAGADVAALSRGESAETAQAVTGLGRRFKHIACDLRDASVSELGQIVDQIAAEWGRLDILVNNAGTIRRGAALEFSESDWDDVIQINLKSVYFLSQAAARRMAQQGGGKIINIASMLSFQGGILVSSYTAAKSGLAGITRALANEWAKHNINVNAIAPGYIVTDNTAVLYNDPDRAPAIVGRIPAGRWGTPDDLKGTVVWMASAASDYLHGAIIPVDGGWLAR
ncbi:MAG TPA: 2-dehydro-3-deoxy-D-gluconate 5-dehydrogenase KduD [Anaerolineales bacterium]|nr:2-dehydro-3-deoxy-D-gluconate 5-dehydrogenase KduD [Anaerolineales bacterium]